LGWLVRDELVATSRLHLFVQTGKEPNQIRSDKDKRKTSEQPVQESVQSVPPIEKISIHVQISQKKRSAATQ